MELNTALQPAESPESCPFCNLVSPNNEPQCPRCKFPAGGTAEAQTAFVQKWKAVKTEYYKLEDRLRKGRGAIRTMAVLSVLALGGLLNTVWQYYNSIDVVSFFGWALVLQVGIVGTFLAAAFVLARRAPRPTFAICSLVLILMALQKGYGVLTGMLNFIYLFGFILNIICAVLCLRAYLAAEKIEHATAQYHELQRLRTGKDPEGV